MCENKDADQLISTFAFTTRILQSLYFLNPKFQASSNFCNWPVRFVSDQVRNPEDRFSPNEAHEPVYVDGVSADMLIYHEVNIEDDNIFFDTAKYLQTILSPTGKGMLKYEPILSLSQSSKCPSQS